MEHTQI